jgi:hypothetical protein
VELVPEVDTADLFCHVTAVVAPLKTACDAREPAADDADMGAEEILANFVR